MAIRLYRPEDLAELQAMQEQLQTYLAGLDPLRKLRCAPDYKILYVERMLQRAGQDERAIFVAEEGGDAIGFTAGSIRRQGKVELTEMHPTVTGHIEELFVRERMRGQGIGKALMERMEAHFTAAGCNYMSVDVFAPNEGAHALYHKLGYADRTIKLTKVL
jgi:ribosomal protein S18 acetylase RimI-like enzyme